MDGGGGPHVRVDLGDGGGAGAVARGACRAGGVGYELVERPPLAAVRGGRRRRLGRRAVRRRVGEGGVGRQPDEQRREDDRALGARRARRAARGAAHDVRAGSMTGVLSGWMVHCARLRGRNCLRV